MAGIITKASCLLIFRAESGLRNLAFTHHHSYQTFAKAAQLRLMFGAITWLARLRGSEDGPNSQVGRRANFKAHLLERKRDRCD